MYMVSGHVMSPDGDSVYLYSSGQPFTHGGDSSNQTWKQNTGIRLLTLRKDGFVSVDAPYEFKGGANNTLYPNLVTVNVRVPALPCPLGHHVALAVNFVTSVAGFVAVGVQDAESGGAEAAGFGLADANRLKGNAVAATASWGSSGSSSMDAFVGKEVAFRVAMADSSLYSLDFQCA